VTGPGRAWLHPVTLVLRDTLILDRWRWLSHRLPRPAGPARLLDVGCAAGGFAMGAARRGYEVLGLDHSAGTILKAKRRAAWLGVSGARFEETDARRLGERTDLLGAFDVVICCETIEHLLDDAGFMRSLAGCLKPGGRLLLTAPYAGFKAITRGDDDPPSTTEDGGHVRRGYDAEGLKRLCAGAGLAVSEISSCSGVVSQKITALYRLVGARSEGLGALLIMPLRPLPLLLDRALSGLLSWPPYTIALVAVRPNGSS